MLDKIFYIKLRRVGLKFFIVFIIVAFFIKLLNIRTLNLAKEKQLTDIKKSLQIKLNENNNLQEQVNSGIGEDFIENFAREKLNMSYPNERAFVEVLRN